MNILATLFLMYPIVNILFRRDDRGRGYDDRGYDERDRRDEGQRGN